MRHYRITGNYGTFEISRVVEAENEVDAWGQSGIMYDLEIAGWTFTSRPEGESWEIVELLDRVQPDVAISDASTLDLMAEQLSGKVWTADDIVVVAELLRAAGRTVEPVDVDIDGAQAQVWSIDAGERERAARDGERS